MENQASLFREKRQFGRIKISEPTICQVYLPQSRKFRTYQGLIKTISLGGIYFVCDEKLPLEKDDVRHLIFNVIYNYQKIYRLKLHALVIRTDNGGSKFAVAVKFLSDPIYYPLNKIDRELPFLDKTRIMYQNYAVYKKAYELIKKTQDIRTERINTIKQSIDQDLYKIDHNQLARFITDSLTDNFYNIAEEFYRRILK